MKLENMIEGLREYWKRLHGTPLDKLTAQIGKGNIAGTIGTLARLSGKKDTNVAEYFDPLVQRLQELATQWGTNPFSASFHQAGNNLYVENYRNKGYLLPLGFQASMDLIYPRMTNPKSEYLTIIQGAAHTDPIHNTGISFNFSRREGEDPTFSCEGFKVESISTPALHAMDYFRSRIYR